MDWNQDPEGEDFSCASARRYKILLSIPSGTTLYGYERDLPVTY